MCQIDHDFLLSELDRRVLADIFWWGEVEQELRDQKFPEFIFKSKADRETCMAEIDQARRNGLYPHTDEDCSEKCKERGMYSRLTKYKNCQNPEMYTTMIIALT